MKGGRPGRRRAGDAAAEHPGSHARRPSAMTSRDGRYTIVTTGRYTTSWNCRRAHPARPYVLDVVRHRGPARAYAAWGTACVQRLNGIWAFGIWDAREQTLFLSRDRFGVKPLFLPRVRASWPSRLRSRPYGRCRGSPPIQISGSSERTCRTVRWPGEPDLLPEIGCFPAAHSLLISAGTRRWSCYWPAPALATDASFRRQPEDDDRIDEFKSLLIDAVALQLRSDVAIGSCLSGGLDSSSIVSIAAALRSRP